MNIATVAITEITTTTAKCGGTITGDSGDYVPLVDVLMRNKFKLYQKNREKLVGDVRLAEPFQPLSLFSDDKQDMESGSVHMQFILTAYKFKPISGICSVELQEYDNSSDVTLQIV